MKIIITGMQCVGKGAIAEYLSEFGMRQCERYSNVRRYNNNDYMTRDTKPFTIDDIIEIVDNNAHVFNIVANERDNTYVGVATSDFDACDFLVLSPQELCEIPEHVLRETIVVWVDAPHDKRVSTFTNERRSHSFDIEESREQCALRSFVDLFFALPNRLYFVDELPERIATILYTLHTYERLVPLYTKTFN